MIIPEDLKYTENDEWVRLEGGVYTVGVTDYAQDQLSDVVYAEVTVAVDELIEKDEVIGSIESVKAAADVYAPVSGTITAVNELIDETPEVINSDPYGDAWLVQMEAKDMGEIDTLMDHKAYETYIAERDH